MSIIRENNWVEQQRVDLPHLRSIDLGIQGDFDTAFGLMLAGGKPLILSGFSLVTTNAIGNSSLALILQTANSLLINYLASESGSIFSVPANRAPEVLNISNPKIIGSFTPSATNFIAIDLVRSTNSATTDLIEILDSSTLQEIPKDVPLAITLDYVIYISTSDFSSTPNLAPVAIVATNSVNTVTSIQDARQLMFSLSSGGSVPNLQSAYPWTQGRSNLTTSSFTGGDKSITSLKSWQDAVMTRLWDIGGGAQWFSPTADRNVQMVRSGAVFTNGEYFEWSGTNLHWKGLTFIFDNSSPANFNDVNNQTSDSPGLTDLADGDCIYVDLDRTVNRTGGTALQPVKTAFMNLGFPTIPGSRNVVAWRVGANIYTRNSYFSVGTAFQLASDTAFGVVKLTYAAGNPADPLVMPQDANGSMSNTAISGGGYGLQGIGEGGGTGIVGTGGTTSGAGAVGLGGSPNGIGVFGIGTGSGSGIKGVGGSSGPGGYFQGGAGGNAIVTIGNSFNVPSAIFEDSGGNLRSLIDHTGYPMGRITHFSENWLGAISLNSNTNPIPNFPQWQYLSTDTNGTIASGAASGTSFPSPTVVVTVNTTAGETATILTAQQVFSPNINSDFVLEWEASIDTAGATWHTKMGILDAVSPNEAILITGSNAAGSWQYQTTTGGVSSTGSIGGSTGTATYPSNRFRIEYHGASTPYGAATAIFWVNETPTVVTAHMPAVGTPMYIIFQLSTSGGNLSTLLLGGIDSKWNRQATMPAL